MPHILSVAMSDYLLFAAALRSRRMVAAIDRIPLRTSQKALFFSSLLSSRPYVVLKYAKRKTADSSSIFVSHLSPGLYDPLTSLFLNTSFREHRLHMVLSIGASRSPPERRRCFSKATAVLLGSRPRDPNALITIVTIARVTPIMTQTYQQSRAASTWVASLDMSHGRLQPVSKQFLTFPGVSSQRATSPSSQCPDLM